MLLIRVGSRDSDEIDELLVVVEADRFKPDEFLQETGAIITQPVILGIAVLLPLEGDHPFEFESLREYLG